MKTIADGWTEAGFEWLAKGCPPMKANLKWQDFATEEEKDLLAQALVNRRGARENIDRESAFIAKLRNTCVLRKRRAQAK